ncbi:MAG: hypothetical protein EOO41_02370, partial [Methanobacteriota archaeon]
IGVVGLGMIGMEVARRCRVLDMHVIGFDPLVPHEKAAAAGVRKVSFETLLAESDVITLHAPLNDATRHCIRADTLARCKRGVYIVNCARGEHVHEADLLANLESGHVAGAALDVLASEPPVGTSAKLVAHPHVTCTPHLGASTEEARRQVARDIATRMCDALDGSAYVGVVNTPFLALSLLPTLEPYVRLAEALGSLQGQLLSDVAVRNMSLRIDVEGQQLETAGVPELVRAATLTGMLPQLRNLNLEGRTVSLVNAALLADEAQVKVTVVMATNSTTTFTNVIRLTLSSPDGDRVAQGTVVEGEPRIVQLDQWQHFPSFTPRGHVLMFNSTDEPGVVGNVMSILSQGRINVASIAVARQPAGAPALTIIMCDARVEPPVLAAIAGQRSISGVTVAHFEEKLPPTTAFSGSVATIYSAPA